MNNQETKTVKNVVVYGLAFFIAMLYMQIYLSEPVYTFIKRNVTTSNILPYGLLIIIFILAAILGNWVIKTAAVRRIFEKMNKTAAVIISWALVITNMVLLIISYLTEMELFDGPTPEDFTFHMNDKITLLVMAAVLLLVVGIIENMSAIQEEKQKNKVYFYLFALLMGILFAYVMFTPNCYMTFYNLHHANAYYNSVYNAMHAAPRTELNSSVYGFYGILLAPFVKLLGGTYTDFCYVISFVGVLSYICIIYVLAKLVQSPVVKYAGAAALVVYNCSMSWGVYRQLIPHRIVFACILLAYLTFMYTHQKMSRLYIGIGYIICALSIVWNFETGIVCLVAYISFFMVEVLKDYSLKQAHFYVELLKKILLAVLTFAGALGFVNIVNLCWGGGGISLRMFLFPTLNSSYMSGFLTTDYQKGVVAWLFIAAMAFVLIGHVISKVRLSPQAESEKAAGIKDLGQGRTFRDNVLFVTAVIALGQMTYYINRSAYGNLAIAYFTAILMLCIICDFCLRGYVNRLYQSNFMNHLCRGFSYLMLTVLAVLILGGIYNYPNAQSKRLELSLRETTAVQVAEEEIASVCPPDTRAIGLSIAGLYSDLGWDSYYHIIDIADIGVYEPAAGILLEELNNRIDEPVLLDNHVIEELEEAGSLDLFYNRYHAEKKIHLYDTEIIYYVPR